MGTPARAYLRVGALGIPCGNGSVLCMLAVLIWSLTVTCKFGNITRKIFALLQVPRGPKTLVVDTGECIQLKQVSSARLSFGLCSLALQFLFCLALLITGCFFLAFASIA